MKLRKKQRNRPNLNLVAWAAVAFLQLCLLQSPSATASPPAPATNPTADPVKLTGNTMGPITYKVLICEPVDDVEQLGQAVDAVLQRVNSLMSTYIADSDVSRINSADADQWVDVDPLTLNVIEKALAISELSDGAFDITVGPAVRRWKFGPKSEEQDYPNDDEVKHLKQIVGYEKILIRNQPPAVKKTIDAAEIDLSAIAKGFAVDQVSVYLRTRGFTNYMVEVGGEVYAAGKKPSGDWQIGIEKPNYRSRQLKGAISVSDNAIATSGDYRNFREYQGRKISHTIDPKTCRPVLNQIASCSIVADDCMTADALATAAMVLGPEAGKLLCQQTKTQASFILRQAGGGKNRFSTIVMTDFPEIKEIGTAAARTSKKSSRSIWPAFIGAMIVFSLTIVGMAVGAIFNQKPITGSCGGIAVDKNADGDSSCSLCHKPVTECPDTVDTAETV